MDRSDALIEGAWRVYGHQSSLPYTMNLNEAWWLCERVRARLQQWYREEVSK